MSKQVHADDVEIDDLVFYPNFFHPFRVTNINRIVERYPSNPRRLAEFFGKIACDHKTWLTATASYYEDSPLVEVWGEADLEEHDKQTETP